MHRRRVLPSGRATLRAAPSAREHHPPDLRARLPGQRWPGVGDGRGVSDGAGWAAALVARCVAVDSGRAQAAAGNPLLTGVIRVPATWDAAVGVGGVGAGGVGTSCCRGAHGHAHGP
jgi:hypothetical protein